MLSLLNNCLHVVAPGRNIRRPGAARSEAEEMRMKELKDGKRGAFLRLKLNCLAAEESRGILMDVLNHHSIC